MQISIYRCFSNIEIHRAIFEVAYLAKKHFLASSSSYRGVTEKWYINIFVIFVSFLFYTDADAKQSVILDSLVECGFVEYNAFKSNNKSGKHNNTYTLQTANKKISIIYSQNNGRGDINKLDKKSTLQYTTNNGIKYFGCNNGEFGGSLIAEHSNGYNNILLHENIVHIKNYDNRLIVFSGLNHLTINRGGVYEIQEFDTMAPKVHTLTMLPEAPISIIYNNNAFFILSRSSFVALYLLGGNKSPVMKMLAFDADWKYSSITSVVNIKDNDNKMHYFLVGTNNGIVVLDIKPLQNIDIRYFTKNNMDTHSSCEIQFDSQKVEILDGYMANP